MLQNVEKISTEYILGTACKVSNVAASNIQVLSMMSVRTKVFETRFPD